MPPRPALPLTREPVAAPGERPPARRSVPVRALAIAAAGVAALAGGYAALRAGIGHSARTAETSAVSAPVPATVAPPVSPPQPAAAPSAPSAPPARDTARPRSAAPVPAIVTAQEIPPVSAPVSTPTPRRVIAERDSASLPPDPDAELAAGGWRPIDRAEAINALGGKLAAIQGLRIESITTSEARGRTRVRVAQLTRSGQRIVLIETAGAEVPSSGAVRATAVSVMPPLEPSGESIGSASLGNLQITARSRLAPDALRPLLGRLGILSQP